MMYFRNRKSNFSENINSKAWAIINQDKPPAEPERLPEFDNSWNIRKPPTVNCSKFNKEGGFQ